MLFREEWETYEALVSITPRPAFLARIPRLDTRAWEWVFSFIWAVLGVQIVTFPEMARGSIFLVSFEVLNQFFSIFISAFLIGFCLIVVGAFGLAALFVNGHSHKIGPRIRACAAIWRSSFYTSVVASMSIVSFRQGHLSPMVTVFGGLIVAEMYVCFRAPLDVKASPNVGSR